MREFLKGAFCAAALVAASIIPAADAAPPTVDQLAKPPADAQHFTILSKAGVHGHSMVWTLPDGTQMSRDSLVLRGQVFEIEQAVHLGSDHMPSTITVRGFTPNGDAGETFAVTNGQATWKSQVDAGSAAYASPAMYIPAGGGFAAGSSVLIEALTAAPNHSLALLPGGRATAERLTEITVGEGAAQKKIVCWAVTGLGTSPIPIWTTEDGKFFGSYGGLALLPAGYEGALDEIAEAQDTALAARSPKLLHALLKTRSGPVAFTHVRAFVDRKFVDDETVVVNKGVIASVGPAAKVRVPKGAQVIDGAGRTLVPGLWDSHQHFPDDSAGPMLLSLGVTSVRDPGNDNAATLARAKRRAAGELLSPHVYPSLLIDGKGPNTAQVATVATTLDEALADVRMAKAQGFAAIKIYGSFNPDWVKPAAAEAHRLGLHVHGHLPAGMRPSQAIAAGYDEITHIYFVMMEAMPEDVVKVSNGMGRFSGTGQYAKDVNLDAEPMKSLIATMAQKHIYSDPTLVVAEALYVPENGDLSAAYAPFTGTLPPATERGFRQGGFVPPQGVTRADYRASFAKLLALVGAMHRAGAPIVAGTDGSGMELVRELELYVQAGFTPEEALESATIVAARNLHVDKTTGSIEVGKVADLDLVEGDPSHNIGDLRNTRIVMLGGDLLDADALRAASGFSGRPHPAN